MALLAVQEIPRNNGAILTTTAADAGLSDEYPNDGRTVLVVENSSGAARTVTVTSVPEARFGRTGNLTIAFTGSGIAFVGPLAPEAFNASDGNVDISVDNATSVAYGVAKYFDSVR
jgi:hypothetical protein